MPEITVNGKTAGEGSPVVIVIRPDVGDPAYALTAAEAFVIDVTDRSPSVWRDGTGTTTVTASQQPSARLHRSGYDPAVDPADGAHAAEAYWATLRGDYDVPPMPDWDDASAEPAVEHRGRPDGSTLYRKPTVTHLGFHGGMIADRKTADVRFALDDGDGGIAVYEADIDQSELFRLLWPALRRVDR